MRIEDIQRTIDEIVEDCELGKRIRRVLPVIEKYIKQGCLPDGKPLHADEGMVLRKVAGLIDDEPDPARAAELARDVESSGAFEPGTEYDEKLKAVAKNLHSVTVAFIYKGEPASGTVVRIEDRVFIATAAHSVPPLPSGRITFVPPVSTDSVDATPPILSYGKCRNKRPDVGYLEVHPSFVSNVLRCNGITLDRIVPSGAGMSERMCYLAGYPSDALRQSNQPDATEYVFTCQIYPNLPIMPEEWNLVTQHRKPEFHGDSDIDIYLPYPTTEQMRCIMGTLSSKLSAPYGLSGGGLWQPLVTGESSIWSPEKYGLIGIQSMWPQEARFLQASQIIHWINLLWHDRKELRDTLQGTYKDIHFPIATAA